MRSESLARSLGQALSSDRYILHATGSEVEFFDYIEQHKQQLDCLVLQDDGSLTPVINRLYEQATLLPVVIFPKESEVISCKVVTNNLIDNGQITDNSSLPDTPYLFHAAEIRLGVIQQDEIGNFIEQAIAKFLSLSAANRLPEPSSTVNRATEPTTRSFVMQQQHRLSEKLKERLGYLGVYYKRNPKFFLRHLPEDERQMLLENLKSEYRQIVLKYFSQESTVNQKIDNFVDKAFFADISVSRIVEIHMELMEEFSKQLKLEGRSEEVLLDYRLTLIDVIAHLGEMYRRSIPRES
ncbi:MAG: circadian clock protein KaiA [Coleofasciculus sp. S288]|nr:circadian clock protein KaiA [Coleofasciculus sp. S288]